MRYSSENEAAGISGLGYLGQLRQGPDGRLYQYVQGVDGLGNPVGFWRRVRRLARRAVARALPIARQFAPLIPGGAAALTAVTPLLKTAGVAGLGELYQAPDGSLYRLQQPVETGMQGLEQPLEVGALGEVRQAPDGGLYQWVEGMDGLGGPVGFWKKLARRPLQTTAEMPPEAAPYRTAAAMEPAALQGLHDDEALQGLDEDEELQGLDDDPEFAGLEDGDDLMGLDDDLSEEGDFLGTSGFDDGEDLEGFDDGGGIDGYLRQDGVGGLERYEPESPPQTRWHRPAGEAPEIWKPLW